MTLRDHAASPISSTAHVSEHQVLHGLLMRCAQRDESALAEYYQVTSRILNAIISRRVGSPRAVEDALVTLYVSVWRRADEFGASPGESAWEWTLAMVDQVCSEHENAA